VLETLAAWLPCKPMRWPCRFCNLMRPGPLLCGHPSSEAIASHLLHESNSTLNQGSRVTAMTWDSAMSKWMLQGVHGFAKDADKQGSLTAIGSYDAVVLTDSAAFRPASAGRIEIANSSPGTV
jgi:hypothetical protein